MFGAFRKSHAHGHEINELESLVDSLENRTLESIQFLYHMTTTENMRKIFDEGIMKPRQTETPYWSALSRDAHSPIGVWFNASLYHKELPVTSVYGDTRIKIPCHFIVQNMFKPRLYLETFFYFKSSPRNQIIRVVLVDAATHRKEAEWCEKNCLVKLNMLDNKILILDSEKKVYKGPHNDGTALPYIWVEVLVVGHVATVAMDTVEETRPVREDPTPGKIPPLV